MLVAGIVISVIGLLVVLGGLLQKNKAKKILAAPFKKTGEVAANPQVADAKGMISCEGAIQTQQPVMAPCSNSPCVYYELKVEKQVEESKMTDRGMQTSRHWKTVSEQKQGSYFQLNDGSGPIGVDCREGLDADLKQSYSGAPPGGQGLGILANLLTGAIFNASERIIQYRATERILPVEGNLFVMGQLKAGQITKPEGMMGKLIVSPKGRDGLVGAVNRMALILWIVGGLVVVGGIPVMFMKDAAGNECAKDFKGEVKECSGKMQGGGKQEVFSWTVDKPGVYEVVLKQPADASTSAWPIIQVENEAGFPMNVGLPFIGGGSDEASTKISASKGKYKIYLRTDGTKVEGGYRYLFSIRYLKALSGGDDTSKASKGDDDDKGSSDDDKPAKKKNKNTDDK